ncbi:MAG: type VI secretion system contractile sheath protein TssC, partial [Bacteroidota bacterium]|nr:type VI secretion system contractile sheath protein TssC [Bacteroidota bacterium]
MANEENEIQGNKPAEREKIKELTVEQTSTALVKYGGFGIVETTIEGAQNLNPEKKARKKIFLSEDAKKEERTALKKRLEHIIELLTSSDSVAELVENAQTKADNAQTLLNKNLKNALEATRELERSYRSVNNFFKNTDQDKI